MPESPTLADVHAAAGVIAGRVHRTPMLTSATLAERCGVPVWLKAELFQRTGSFKPRGAFNRVRALTAEERDRGAITISAGNHAQALAVAARDEGVDALVFMPADASPAKVAATRGYGATVDLESADTMEALERMRAVAAESGRVIVHPYDDPLVVAGQGTVGLEIAEDAPDAGTVVVPIGGGGLIAGIATAVKGLRADARVIGVEPELSAAMRTAMDTGGPIPAVPGPTIADALRSPVAGTIALEVCSRLVDDVVLVSDEEIREGMRFLYERAKLACEPGAAVGVGALLAGRLDVAGSSGVVFVISGGNVAPQLAAEILAG
ncbi:MAG TPA: threonine/serine dehydratase [Gaiellales bacterium]|nr:threonine/serine dehydratase [Gaiellales bacterium]